MVPFGYGHSAGPGPGRAQGQAGVKGLFAVQLADAVADLAGQLGYRI
jgi:hypothetical protein